MIEIANTEKETGIAAVHPRRVIPQFLADAPQFLTKIAGALNRRHRVATRLLENNQQKFENIPKNPTNQKAQKNLIDTPTDRLH